MIVISITSCPPRLRGALTQWLAEIDPGVYVGNVSVRIRDELWERIKKETGGGRAIMVFSARNEQRMDFRVHNSLWEPIDYDGLKLMMKPNAAHAAKTQENKNWRSTDSGVRTGRRVAAHRASAYPHSYVVVDVETTGFSAAQDRLIEVGAIRIRNDLITEKYSALILSPVPIPENITQLTGITNAILQSQGVEERRAISELLHFIGNDTVISHNVRFDYGFIREACKRSDQPLLSNECIDTASLAKKSVPDAENFKLATLAEHYSIDYPIQHRSIEDCIATKQIYDKLIEKPN